MASDTDPDETTPLRRSQRGTAHIHTPTSTPPSKSTSPTTWTSPVTPSTSNNATARQQIRRAIEEDTRPRRDAFLIHHNDVFLAVLPPNNYITKLGNTTHRLVTVFQLVDQPAGVTAMMKPYQLEGLSFLVIMYRNGMPAILGDEMGLGKTLQALSFIQWLRDDAPGNSTIPTTIDTPAEARPCLVICPLSVLSSWEREARKWTPSLAVVILHGPRAQRQELKKSITSTGCDLCLTTYETFVAERHWFQSAFVWRYVILDEGHKIKNATTQIAIALHSLSAEYRLLLTGTPIQNDLREMWALLHWMLPDVFPIETQHNFRDAFNLAAGKASTIFLGHARRLLEVVMIRRMKDSPGVDLGLPPKEEVLLYVPLTDIQREWYMKLLTRMDQATFNEVFKDATRKELSSVDPQDDTAPAMRPPEWKKLMNLVMQLRKICSHPFLIEGAQPEPYHLDDRVRSSSGKFVVLDKLVDEVVIRNKKKLIVFSGFTSTLDLCEDLLHTKGANQLFHGLRYARLDGDASRAMRNLSMRLFNDTTSGYDIMLISTRAGGLGITLVSASDVCFLDEDWNPQVTLQAEARAHRIGQTQKVTIYKLCTQGTVEDQMLSRIRKKLYLSTKVTEEMQNLHKVTPTKKRGHDDGADETQDDAPNLGVSALMTLLRRGSQTLTTSAVDVGKMMSWDWHTVIAECREKPKTIEEIAITEQTWLSQIEKVESSVFEGRKHHRAPEKKTKIDLNLSRAERRIGKNTTVMVNGYAVDKNSMGCAQWEAVPTIAGKDSRLAGIKREKVVINHQDHCQVCWQQDGDIKCAGCPRSFHLQCLDSQVQYRALAFNFYCDQHKCAECQKSTADSGGLVYRCRWCPRAYCEDCLDFDTARLLDSTLKEYEMLNYNTTGAWYVECHTCVSHWSQESAIQAHIEMQKRQIESAWMLHQPRSHSFEMQLDIRSKAPAS